MYRKAAIFVLLALTGITRAFPPEIRGTPNDPSPNAEVVPEDHDSLIKRGEHCDKCEDTPKFRHGRLHTECLSKNCCRRIGLNPDVPQVRLYSTFDLL
jgi:hypothetical protein